MDLGDDLHQIYPVELMYGSLYQELLNAEEQGRQRSRFCIQLEEILARQGSKFRDPEKKVLYANLILRICRFELKSKEELHQAIAWCTGLAHDDLGAALDLLETEYGVLSYDDRMYCYDFVAEAVGANDFRRYMGEAVRKTMFQPAMLTQSDILEMAGMQENVETEFGAIHGIQTREWQFEQHLMMPGYKGRAMAPHFCGGGGAASPGCRRTVQRTDITPSVCPPIAVGKGRLWQKSIGLRGGGFRGNTSEFFLNFTILAKQTRNPARHSKYFRTSWDTV